MVMLKILIYIGFKGLTTGKYQKLKNIFGICPEQDLCFNDLFYYNGIRRQCTNCYGHHAKQK